MNIKILTARSGYHNDEPEIKLHSPSELFNDEKEALAKEFLSTLPADRILPLLDHLNLSNSQWEKYLKQIGYAPTLKAEKIPELKVLVENGIYWDSTYNTFSPIKSKDSYFYDKALKHKGKFFVEVEFSNQHPFAIAKKNVESKEQKLKEEKAAKKKEREIQKARKLLEQV